jgi:hypothetical protein
MSVRTGGKGRVAATSLTRGKTVAAATAQGRTATSSSRAANSQKVASVASHRPRIPPPPESDKDDEIELRSESHRIVEDDFMFDV